MGKRRGRANIPTPQGLSAPETPRPWEAAGQPPPADKRQEQSPLPLPAGQDLSQDSPLPASAREDAKESLRPPGRSGGQPWYLQPLLSLLLALHGQHQCLGPRQREPQLVLLAPPILGDVDDVAGAQGHLHVWLPVLGAFVALGEAKGTAQPKPACPAAMPGRAGVPLRVPRRWHRWRWLSLCNSLGGRGLQGALSLHCVPKKRSPPFTCKGSQCSLCMCCRAVAALGQGLGLDSATFLQLGPNHPHNPPTGFCPPPALGSPAICCPV